MFVLIVPCISFIINFISTFIYYVCLFYLSFARGNFVWGWMIKKKVNKSHTWNRSMHTRLWVCHTRRAKDLCTQGDCNVTRFMRYMRYERFPSEENEDLLMMQFDNNATLTRATDDKCYWQSRSFGSRVARIARNSIFIFVKLYYLFIRKYNSDYRGIRYPFALIFSSSIEQIEFDIFKIKIEKKKRNWLTKEYCLVLVNFKLHLSLKSCMLYFNCVTFESRNLRRVFIRQFCPLTDQIDHVGMDVWRIKYIPGWKIFNLTCRCMTP